MYGLVSRFWVTSDFEQQQPITLFIGLIEGQIVSAVYVCPQPAEQSASFVARVPRDATMTIVY